MRRIALLAAVPLVLGMAGCGSAEPPAAGAKVCRTEASWWFDATGAGDLTGLVTNQTLPLTNPSQSEVTYSRSDCRVYSGDDTVGNFQAKLVTRDEGRNMSASIAMRPADSRFTAAGGIGLVDGSDEDISSAWWICKTTVLRVELRKPKDEDSRLELVKTLTQHIAGVTGCPGPTP